jgi:hypothetical protein
MAIFILCPTCGSKIKAPTAWPAARPSARRAANPSERWVRLVRGLGAQSRVCIR